MDTLCIYQHFTLLWMATVVSGANDGTMGVLNGKPRCGDWMPFKNDKCIKITDEAILRNQDDAEEICESFSEDLHWESFPKLITIKSQEDQGFLQSLLVEKNVVDSVWLGLKVINSGKDFMWNDGSELVYSKWADQAASVHHCVELASGNGGFPAGSWVKVNCQKRNRVVCERKQTWTLETLQNTFLQYKEETQKEIMALRLVYDKQMKALENVHEQKLEALQEETKTLLDNSKLNPVPKGFIYVQLPGQEPPTHLWPLTTWIDESAAYCGLFFRVEGGNAAPFGEVQEESTKRLDQVHLVNNGDDNNLIHVPDNGTWSPTIQTGVFTRYRWVYSLKFRISPDEIRPRNQAVKIWKRI